MNLLCPMFWKILESSLSTKRVNCETMGYHSTRDQPDQDKQAKKKKKDISTDGSP